MEDNKNVGSGESTESNGETINVRSEKPQPIAEEQSTASNETLAQPAEKRHEPVVTGGGSRGTSSRFSKLAMLTVALLLGTAGAVYVLASHADTPASDKAVEARPSFVANGNVPEFVPDSVLLKFKEGVPAEKQNGLIARYGSVKSEIPQIGVKEIKVPAEALDAVIAALSHNPAIQFAEKNFTATATASTGSTPTVTPNDTYYSSQWGITKTQANSAWTISQGATQTVIAVIDTGADFSHPDLKGKLLSTGYDFINNDSNPQDDHGHGTSTSGEIAALTNNGAGVSALCWNCMILPVKALNSSGSGSYTAIANAITYAADHGAKIINMSLGGPTTSSTLDNAVNYAHNKNITLLGSAGNNGTTALNYPGASPGVVSIAGTDSRDALYSWSERGTWVDIAAPGCDYTTKLGGDYNSNFCGTSAAAPVVSGIVGLLLSAKPTATNAQIENALISTTDTCCSGLIGHGRVNAYKAIQSLSTTAGDTTAPTATISAPANAATVSGPVSVTVNASDNVAVAKVELYRNGTLVATTTTSPYSFLWDTTANANGSYTLSAKAYDAAGNIGTSPNLSVTISNNGTDTIAPTVTISQPTSGSAVSGKQVVSGSATDSKGVVEMDIYIDGVLKQTSTNGTVTYNWNAQAGNVKSGSHTIVIKAYDAAGNVGTSTVDVNK